MIEMQPFDQIPSLLGQQQPEAEALPERMRAVASACLEQLHHPQMQVAQKQVMELPTAIKFLLEVLSFDSAGCARDLHYGPEWHALGTQENRNPEDSFVPHKARANHRT